MHGIVVCMSTVNVVVTDMNFLQVAQSIEAYFNSKIYPVITAFFF